MYEIEIFPDHRRQGYATQAFTLLEQDAGRHGAASIQLHVFGHNHAARTLYEDLGFVPTNLILRKNLKQGRPAILPGMIEAATVQHLAALSRLELTESESEAMLSDLNKMLGYFEKLQELDTEGVPEMQRPVSLVNVMREDVPGEMFAQQTVTELAPESQDGFIRVPRTVEG